MHKYAEDVRKEIRELLHHKVQVGDRFSVTTDEYTSLKIARHCCVNVHLPGGDHIGLGMIRVTGSLTGERAAEILSHKLEQFGIEDNHVLVANTTDGASVMKKMGRLLKRIHQLCHAHGNSKFILTSRTIFVLFPPRSVYVRQGITELCPARCKFKM